MAHSDTPNSRERSEIRRPARCSSTSCWWNSGGYRFDRFGIFVLAIADTSYTKYQVSTKPGDLQCVPGAGLAVRGMALQIQGTTVIEAKELGGSKRTLQRIPADPHTH